MFAPPDPSLVAAAPPPSPPLPTLPTLPSAGSPTAPTLPGAATTQVATAADSNFGAHPDVAPSVDTRAGAPRPLNERLEATAPLLGTRWLRRGAIWASAAALPGAFVGDIVGAALVLLSAVALIAWSGVIAINIRRTRPATRHGNSPHPAIVVFSWFVAPFFGVVAVVAIVSVSMWAGSSDSDEQGTRIMVLVATVAVAGIGVLMAMYQPYRALAKCAKWVNADSGRFRKWFAAPIVAVLLAAVIQVLAGLVVLSDGADGSSSTATMGAAVLWIVSFTLPWLAWLIFGSRAMRSLESGVAHAHGRSVREANDPSQGNPLPTGHAASGAMPAFSAPNA